MKQQDNWSNLLEQIYQLHYQDFQAGLLRKEILLVAGKPGCWTREQVDTGQFTSGCDCGTCVQADRELAILEAEIKKEV